MSDQPFHHGNLRAVLLAEAERTLREDGLDALSLRELARRAGVSHGAPRHHFPDRHALLNALAERGFRQLTDEIQASQANDAESYDDRLTAAARAYVRFAIDDSVLLDLMFTRKNAEPSAALQDAADHFFVTMGDVIAQGRHAGRLQLDNPARLQLLLGATLQGIAALVASGRLPAGDVDALIADAITLFTRDRRPQGTRTSLE